jgi:hypothetical protein
VEDDGGGGDIVCVLARLGGSWRSLRDVFKYVDMEVGREEEEADEKSCLSYTRIEFKKEADSPDALREKSERRESWDPFVSREAARRI